MACAYMFLFNIHLSLCILPYFCVYVMLFSDYQYIVVSFKKNLVVARAIHGRLVLNCA